MAIPFYARKTLQMKEVSVIFGTRPEAIKLCPLILELHKWPQFDVDVCATAQHREMLY
jgi:UDP-N-acetylglucosamine 2-epimerase (non-hydrolysing)